MVDGLRNGQRLGIGLPKYGCPPLGIGVPQSIGLSQVQILQGFGFLVFGGLGSKGILEQGFFHVHFRVETPGLFLFASTGAVPVMQTKESIRGRASSFFMIIIIS